MVTKEKQRRRFDKEWETMLGRMEAYVRSHAPEDLHQMRVAMKKARALMRFFKSRSKKKKQSAKLETVKSIFRHAGEIRDLQVRLRLAEKYGLTKAFRKEQQELLQHAVSEFSRLYEEQYRQELEKAYRKLSKGFRDMKDGTVVRKYRKKLKEISEYFDGEDPAKDLHEQRKQIKILLYVHKVLEAPLAQALSLDTKYLHKLQDAIGDWHDLEASVEFFSGREKINKSLISRLAGRRQKALRSALVLSRNFYKKTILATRGKEVPPQKSAAAAQA